MNFLNSTKTKWTIFGILFGGLFPITGTLVKIQLLGIPFSWNSAVQAQRVEQILWIVDLAPIVLGAVFHLVGKREHELQQTNEHLNRVNQQLSELQANLEQLVEERTAELAMSSDQATKRANQLNAVTDLSRSLVSFTDIETLLQETTRLVSQRLGYYHTGIFLLDEQGQYAVLRAANSRGGQKMLERGHRLRVGQSGIVGDVTSTGHPRIELNIKSNTIQSEYPELPDTRSVIAIPLKSGRNVIGALDVHSTQPDAFSQEDLDTLSILADQVSAALENVRLHEEMREALTKAETIYHQLIGETWANIRRTAPLFGYTFDGNRAKPLIKSAKRGQIDDGQEAFSVPVQLRGESIGSLRIKSVSHEREWTEDEIAIIQATAERVALAIENARLVEESQKRASKEQIIGEISTKIGASINLDNILQTTLREMGRILPGADINIQVENK